MTVRMSDCAQREAEPSFMGFGIEPSATRRQKVGTLMDRRSSASRTFRRGVILVAVESVELVMRPTASF